MSDPTPPSADVARMVERLVTGDLIPEMHPTASGLHEVWDRARLIVGHHHAKSDLVQVVGVLLIQVERLTKERDQAVERASRFGGNENIMRDDLVLACLARDAAEAQRDALQAGALAMAKLEKSIMSDIQTAHDRGSAASKWMREDDRDMRAELRHAFGLLRAALPPAQQKTKE